MKNITVLLFLFISGSLLSQTYSGPESVEFDYVNSRWLIANTTSHQVLARDAAGNLTVFATGLVNGPYGIEIVDGVLYCCSGSSIKGYSLATGMSVFNLNIGASFLNGLTHDNLGNLFATDFSSKKIFKVNISSQVFSAIATGLVQSPNGIVFDQANNRCVFVNWGTNAPIKAIDLSSFSVTTLIATTNSNCDGIAKDAIGNYYVSTWGNQNVIRYDSTFANPSVTVATGLSNPADIFINTTDNILGIPNASNNTVSFINLTLGVNNFDKDWLKAVTVFPNPIIDKASFTFELNNPMKVSAQIIDLQGKTIETIVFQNEILQNGTVEINRLKLSSGNYFLVFKAAIFSKSIPFIVQ